MNSVVKESAEVEEENALLTEELKKSLNLLSELHQKYKLVEAKAVKLAEEKNKLLAEHTESRERIKLLEEEKNFEPNEKSNKAIMISRVDKQPAKTISNSLLNEEIMNLMPKRALKG